MKVALISDTHFGFSHNTHLILEKFYKRVQKENPDVVLHAGDHIATKYEEKLEKALKQLNHFFDEKVVYAVLGNHDYWRRNNPSYTSWERLSEFHKELFDKYNITHLDGNGFYFQKVYFTGFDGWYKHLDPPTNDIFWLPKIDGENPHHFLNARATKQFTKIIDDVQNIKTKKVLLTHFPSYFEMDRYILPDFSADSSFMDLIVENFDYYCTGHSHTERDFMKGNCRILNCGSDYDEPEVKIFEIETEICEDQENLDL